MNKGFGGRFLPSVVPLVFSEAFQLGPITQPLIIIPHGPVSFEEVGLGDILPPDSCLDALSGHSAPEQRDVLRVRRLESCVLEDPETVS